MENKTINNKIVNVFNGFRMAPTPIDEYEQKGKQILIDKLQPFIDQGKPINFVMLGFPMKSPNDRDKVIGKLPDLAEEVTMQNFENFNNKIKTVYEPGVKLSIVSDGFVFNDIMGVSDQVVEQYNEMSFSMAKNAPVEWFTLKDFFKGELNAIREKVSQQFGITPEVLEQRILLDPDVNSLYRGMIKFMVGDLAIRDFASNTQLQKQAKIVAREMMFRNEAYSKLVQSEFNNHIRLSMHPSVNNGTKYSFQLIPSPKAWTSPWHCALLLNNGEIETIHRKEAIAAGHELIYKDGQPYYFQTKK